MQQLFFAILVAPANPVVQYFYQIFHKDPFRGIYQPNAFDLSILIPYFTILIILSIYGIHRYCLTYLYMKNRRQGAEAARAVRAAAARHDPASDLQRALRGGAAAGGRHAHRLSARTAGNSGARRLDRRDAHRLLAPGQRVRAARAIPSPTITATTARASRPERWPRA